MSGRFAIIPSNICCPQLGPVTHVTSVVPGGPRACDLRVCQGRIRLRGMKYKSSWGQLKTWCCAVESSWNRELGDRSCRPSSTLTPMWALGSTGACFLICKIYVLGRESFWIQGKSVPHLGFSFSSVLFKNDAKLVGHWSLAELEKALPHMLLSKKETLHIELMEYIWKLKCQKEV